jgi:hypothetical protein
VAHEEIKRRFPATVLFGKTVGDGYYVPPGQFSVRMLDKAREADGISDYSRAYWKVAESGANFDTLRAINETLSEARRLQVVPTSKQSGDSLHPLWAEFSAGIAELSKKGHGDA